VVLYLTYNIAISHSPAKKSPGRRGQGFSEEELKVRTGF
jgi:hypothetical protein